MAIVGYEAIAIVAVLAIIFLWGPQKLPEMAKAIGQAKREFDKASKEVSTLADPSSIIRPQTNTQASTPATAQPVQPSQDPIVIAAKSLGIRTEEKTKEELAKEILIRTTDNHMQTIRKETAVGAAGR